MGIPKFFRWISERYPLCSQLIQENRIPEFDNLYLDMNGIIHNCSHPNDNDVHFRMTEEQIFLAIFNYIDHLFSKIRPQKLFFLAVDGVAPRAKMNQQRARRFRTAKDNADARQRAVQRGEALPDEPPFDSNCITPGTPFMARLQEQLKYFINKKITEDSAWHGVEVILSGHEVPGEGEHKIMEYLRLAKSQPDYDPNVRHCLYGLDADLMMLGLLSHEPHFALLREEVTFGRTRKKSAGPNPEAQNFYLMHLSLFREYLDAEFNGLRQQLPFPYDLERIIDDFILMAYFVGNDFLPNLPGLHINEGAMTQMFRIYKKVLVEAGGYLNDGGKIQLDRCEIFLRHLGEHERELFEVEVGDALWLRGKRANGQVQHAKKSQIVMTKVQKAMYNKIKSFVLAGREHARLTFSANMPARDRAFVIKLANELGISHTVDALGEGKELPQHHIILDWDEDDDEDDEESMEARQRVLRKWSSAEVVDEEDMAANIEAEQKQKMDEAFLEWKREYYKEKLEIDYNNHAQMSELIYHYVEGLQWVANYYYNGVASWEWFYPYHYAPKITDIVDISKLNFTFDLGRPFLPFEQLMGVLPAASRQHIPEAFRDLMSDPSSPIIDFYPLDFELDLNGKKQDWEAIVKIPFIDEERLLRALKSRENQLTKEEKSRNRQGESYIFELDANNPHQYMSPLPGTFPDISQCLCKMSIYHLPVIGVKGFVKGLCDGTHLGVRALAGFPSMHTLPHTAHLGLHGVAVFNTESPNESVIISVGNTYEGKTPEAIAKEKVGQRIYVLWPFLQEAYVASITDEYFRYEIKETGGRKDVVKVPQTQEGQDRFYKSSERIEHHYSKRYGTIIGPVDMLLNVRLLKGMKLREDGSLVKDFAPYKEEIDVALQTVVDSVEFEDPRYKERSPPPLSTEHPIHSRVFFLGTQGYGLAAEVVGYENEKLHIKLMKPIHHELQEGLDFTRQIAIDAERAERYVPSFQVAKQIGTSSLALAKVSSSLYVISKSSDQRTNLGLNLKFDSKRKKVLGFSRKNGTVWEYSQKAIDLIKEYKNRFPELFAGLERKSKNDFYEDTEFYPEETAAAKITEIKEWLKTMGVKDFERVSLDTLALTKDIVGIIESRIDEVYKGAEEIKYKAVTVKNVPRPSVLKPAHARHRLSDQVFDLGDRAVYVVDSGSVPLGAQGTVIGIEGNFLDILFDQTFMGGISLGDRCQQYRGLAVNKNALLNLTHIQPPIEGSKTIEKVPIDRQINRFTMKSGGNAMARRSPWTHREQAPATHNAWSERVPSVLSRNGPPANGPRHVNGATNVPAQSGGGEEKRIYSATSGIRIEVTKRVTPSVAQPPQAETWMKPAFNSGAVRETYERQSVPRNRSNYRSAEEADKHWADNRGSFVNSNQRQHASQEIRTRAPVNRGESRPKVYSPEKPAAPSAVNRNPHPGMSNLQQVSGAVAYQHPQASNARGGSSHLRASTPQEMGEEEQITQTLKSLLHIGEDSAPTCAMPSSMHAAQPSHYVPPHAHSRNDSGIQGYSMPIPSGSASIQSPQELPMEPSNLAVSQQIMAMLHPQQHQAQQRITGTFSPYAIAASATPLRPVQNELAELVKQQGAGRGPGERRMSSDGQAPRSRRASAEAILATGYNDGPRQGPEIDHMGTDGKAADDLNPQEDQDPANSQRHDIGAQERGQGRGFRGRPQSWGYQQQNPYRGGRGHYQGGGYVPGNYRGGDGGQSYGNFRGSGYGDGRGFRGGGRGRGYHGGRGDGHYRGQGRL